MAQFWRARRPREELDFAPSRKICCAGWCVMGRCLPATTSSTSLCKSTPCDVANTRRPAFECSMVDAHTLFDETRKETNAVLCSLMHTSGSGSAFRAGLPWAQTPKSDCSRSIRCHSSERISRRRASGSRASSAICHGSRARPRAAARHRKSSTAKWFSAVSGGARTDFKHRAWRSSCRCSPATSLAAMHASRVVFGRPPATNSAEQRLALCQVHDPW